MVNSMKKVVKSNAELTVEERNLLSVAYKNVIGSRRASWRIISSIEQKEEQKVWRKMNTQNEIWYLQQGNENNVKVIKEYKKTIQAELSNICKDILNLLDQSLIPSAQVLLGFS